MSWSEAIGATPSIRSPSANRVVLEVPTRSDIVCAQQLPYPRCLPRIRLQVLALAPTLANLGDRIWPDFSQSWSSPGDILPKSVQGGACDQDRGHAAFRQGWGRAMLLCLALRIDAARVNSWQPARAWRGAEAIPRGISPQWPARWPPDRPRGLPGGTPAARRPVAIARPCREARGGVRGGGSP